MVSLQSVSEKGIHKNLNSDLLITLLQSFKTSLDSVGL